MRQGHSAAHHIIARAYPDERIEQTVSVQVSKLVPAENEADAPEAMHAQLDAQRAARFAFERFPQTERAPIKESRPHEQHRVEELRKQRHAREPSEISNDECEDHKEASLNLRKQETQEIADLHSLLLH